MDEDIERLRQLPLKQVSAFFQDRRVPLHVMIAHAGHSKEAVHPYRFNNLDREGTHFAVFQLTLDGRGCFETPTERFDLQRGSLMVASVPGNHLYYLPQDSTFWEFVYLVVYGREILRLCSAIEKRLGNRIELSPSSTIPSQLVDIMKSLFSSREMTAFDNSKMGYEICMEIFSNSLNLEKKKEEDRFSALKAFLHKQMARDVSVSEMAEFVGLSRSYFTRLFEAMEGVSPHSFLEDLRLRQSLTLLQKQELSVKEIACSCGIYDVNYFCRLFKKRIGMSPGEFRKVGF